MKPKRFTVNDVMALGPSKDNYPVERVKAIFGSAKSLTLLEILRREDIPASCRKWCATKEGVLTRGETLAWMNLFVGRAVRNHALYCGIRAVERWAARWLRDEDRTSKSARRAQRVAGLAEQNLRGRAGSSAERAANLVARSAWSAALAANCTAQDHLVNGPALASEWAADAAAPASDAEYDLEIADLIGVLEAAP